MAEREHDFNSPERMAQLRSGLELVNKLIALILEKGENPKGLESAFVDVCETWDSKDIRYLNAALHFLGNSSEVLKFIRLSKGFKSAASMDWLKNES